MSIFSWVYLGVYVVGFAAMIIGLPLMCTSLFLAGLFAARNLRRFGFAEGWRHITTAGAQRFDVRSILSVKIIAGVSSLLVLWVLVVGYLRSTGVMAP